MNGNFFVVQRPAKGFRCGVLGLFLAAAILSGCENIALIGRPTLESREPPERVIATIDGVDHQLQEFYLLAEGNQYSIMWCAISAARA